MKAELVLGLGIVALFASCSGDDTKKKVAPQMDASVAGSSGGNRPDAGSGGSSAGQPSAGGEAGTPAQPEGGMGGDGGDGGVGGDGGTPGLVCSPPDFDAAGAGGLGVAGEGGAWTIGGEWHDFEAEACVACPATPILCDDLMGPPAPVYDPATRVLTVHLTPNRAEMVSASLDVNYYAPDVGMGGGGPMPESGNVQVAAAVDRNTLTFDFSSQIPEQTTQVDPGWFTVTDACGVVSASASTVPPYRALRVNLTETDAGTEITTECYTYD